MLSMDVDLFKLCSNKEWSEVRKYLSSDDEAEEDKKFNVMHYTDFMYRHYGTCLHIACRDDAPAPDDIIKALIDIGGKELVMKVDVYDKTALHWACYRSGASYNPSYNIIKMLIEVGGNDLVMAQSDYDGETALTIATRWGASNIIKELLTVQSTTVNFT